MNIGMIKIALMVAAASAALTGVLTYTLTTSYKDGQFATFKLKLEQEYSDTIIKETNLVRQKEQKINELGRALENQHAAFEEKLVSNTLHYNARIADGLRLRDPGASSGGCAQGGDSSTAERDSSEAHRGFLSEELTRLLLAEAMRADSIANQSNMCADYVTGLLKALKTR